MPQLMAGADELHLRMIILRALPPSVDMDRDSVPDPQACRMTVVECAVVHPIELCHAAPLLQPLPEHV